MSSELPTMPSLALASSRYNFTCASITILPSVWTQVAKADPRRWAIRMSCVTASANLTWFSPVKPDFNPSGGTGNNYQFESKFRDYPGSTGSAWYAFNPGGGTIMIQEEIFLG